MLSRKTLEFPGVEVEDLDDQSWLFTRDVAVRLTVFSSDSDGPSSTQIDFIDLRDIIRGDCTPSRSDLRTVMLDFGCYRPYLDMEQQLIIALESDNSYW